MYIKRVKNEEKNVKIRYEMITVDYVQNTQKRYLVSIKMITNKKIKLTASFV